MSASDDLARVLAGTGPILLDFDGPVCSIFAGLPASIVAAELVRILLDHGVEIPEPIAREPDPLAVLRWTATLERPTLTSTIEDGLCAAELRAVATAEPTPYAREVIVAAHQAGRPVAIVSNNSAPAIEAYLDAQRLRDHVKPVIGRAHGEPARMKPDPVSILAAAAAHNAEPRACVLIGDSLTDITGAQAARVPVIAYANRSPKLTQFACTNADAIVTSMADIAAALMAGTPAD